MGVGACINTGDGARDAGNPKKGERESELETVGSMVGSFVRWSWMVDTLTPLRCTTRHTDTRAPQCQNVNVR